MSAASRKRKRDVQPVRFAPCHECGGQAPLCIACEGEARGVARMTAVIEHYAALPKHDTCLECPQRAPMKNVAAEGLSRCQYFLRFVFPWETCDGGVNWRAIPDEDLF